MEEQNNGRTKERTDRALNGWMDDGWTFKCVGGRVGV